jgi:serine/threonine protein kinase
VCGFLAWMLVNRIAKERLMAATLAAAPVFLHSFWAPELVMGTGDAGPRSDVYAAGLVLYTVLTGDVPFKGRGTFELLSAVMQHRPEPPSRLCRSVSPQLDRVCMKCLEKDPARRYPTALALADDLRGFLDREPAEESAGPDSDVRRAQERGNRIRTSRPSPRRLTPLQRVGRALRGILKTLGLLLFALFVAMVLIVVGVWVLVHFL